MDLSEKASANSLHLKEKLLHLNEEQICRSNILSSLKEEKNKLLLGMSQEIIQYPDDETLPHYHYILPLVKEIHLLELKLKEQQREYEKRKIYCEASRLGQAVLADSFHADECVLKKWSKELREFVNKDETGDNSSEKTASMPCSVTNIIYHAVVDKHVYIEDLGFTLLCQGVHVRLRIKSEITCPNIHLPSFPSSARIGVNSDTFVPKLEETVAAVVSQRGHISEVISLLSQYIQEDMAPYVIIIPMKKRSSKSKKNKSKELKPSSNHSENQNVHSQNSEIVH